MSISGSIVSTGVPGLSVTPAFLPSAASLYMHSDDIGAGFGEGLQIRIAGGDHQVHVKRLLGVPPERLHHVGAERNVGNEVAVHHVDMDPVGAGLVDRNDFLAKLGEIGSQNRRGDEQRTAHRFLHSFSRSLTRPPGTGNGEARPPDVPCGTALASYINTERFTKMGL